MLLIHLHMQAAELPNQWIANLTGTYIYETPCDIILGYEEGRLALLSYSSSRGSNWHKSSVDSLSLAGTSSSISGVLARHVEGKDGDL